MVMLSESQAVHSQESAFPSVVWTHKEKTKLRPETTGSPGMYRMWNIEIYELKMFCDIIESSYTSKATIKTSSPAGMSQ